jgi:hypothetical protein
MLTSAGSLKRNQKDYFNTAAALTCLPDEVSPDEDFAGLLSLTTSLLGPAIL